MKKCPFCAEEIQDAATVCTHCGRDVVGSHIANVSFGTAATRRRWPRFLLIAVGVLLAIAAIGALVPGRFLNRHDPAVRCALMAEPAFVGDGEHAIAVGNRDSDEWGDVVVTIHGRGTAPGNRGQASGAYQVHIEDLPSLKRRAIRLDEFQKPDGSRWQPLVMRPDVIEVVARLRGEMCRYESDLK